MSAPLPSPPSLPPWLERRPKTRAECPPPDQQCPWVSCRYHLALSIRKPGGFAPPGSPPRITYALPQDPARWPDDAATCALHVADAGEHTLEQVGAIMGDVSRERIRQIERAGLAKLRRFGIVLDLAEDLGLDTDSSPSKNNRLATHPRPPRESDPDLDGTFAGPWASTAMTATMRRVQAESAPPVRTLSPDAIDLADLEAQIRNKQAPPRTKTNARVTQDLFARRASPERQARITAGVQSYRRIQATASAKADTTTPPRPPSPPSPSPIEIPPAIQAEATPSVPACLKFDDHHEVAVVSALPDPKPKAAPMPSPKPRSHWSKQRAYATSRIKDEMFERCILANEIAQTIAAAHPELRVTSAVGSVNKLLDGGGSPTSVWFRRIAIALDLSLSDLCDDPAWLAAVTTEEAPAVANSPARSVALPPPPVTAPLPTHEDALAPLILAALDKAQAQDKRIAELTTVSDLLRREVSDLREQLATVTQERDDATQTLADIKRRLA